MSDTAPPPPDYAAIAQQQAQASQTAQNTAAAANRPNTNGPAGSTTSTLDPATGQWTQNTNLTAAGQTAFNGQQNTQAGLFGTAQGLTGQVNDAFGTPFSFSQFGQVGTGDQARDQAINAAYGQASSRLDPQWAQTTEQTTAALANQGLRPGDKAYDDALANMNRAKTDAYSTAMNGAIGQGTTAGSAAFNQNMQARNQSIQEALKQRGMPLEEINSLMGTAGQVAQPNAAPFGMQGVAQTPDMLGASEASYNAQLGQYNADQANSEATTDGIMNGIGTAAKVAGTVLPFALSDERLKKNIRRSQFEVRPGVRAASWEWKNGPAGRFVGVIAQDLEKVAPEYVHMVGGVKMVDYSFLKES